MGCSQVTKVAVTVQIEVTEHKNPTGLIGIFLNKPYHCPAMFEEHPLLSDQEAACVCATDPRHFKGLNPYHEGCGCDFKKCCKKYKRGKRCKKCPKR